MINFIGFFLGKQILYIIFSNLCKSINIWINLFILIFFKFAIWNIDMLLFVGRLFKNCRNSFYIGVQYLTLWSTHMYYKGVYMLHFAI